MTVYLLDTNACIHYLRGRNPHVIRRIQARQPQDIRLCSVVQAELFHGAYKSPAPFRAANLALLAVFPAIPQPAVQRGGRGSLRSDTRPSGIPWHAHRPL